MPIVQRGYTVTNQFNRKGLNLSYALYRRCYL
nr:MAG TPA: hypothetical protein [Caudoviricetes sp.]